MVKPSIYLTDSFSKQFDRLAVGEQEEMGQVIDQLVMDSAMGERCRGELSEVGVFNYSYLAQRYLLAYSWSEAQLVLLALDVGINLESGRV